MAEAPPLPGEIEVVSPLDRALSLHLAGEPETSLRWSAAMIEREPGNASAYVITGRTLATLGRLELSIDSFRLGFEHALDAGSLPLAIATIADLSSLGVEVGSLLDRASSIFSAGSSRLADSLDESPPPIPTATSFSALSSMLSGPALLSKVGTILREARRKFDELSEQSPVPLIAPLPIFSSLSEGDLRAVISAFEMVTVPAGEPVVREGEEGAEAYIVARGQLEVRKTAGDAVHVQTRLGPGDLFGEMALLSRAPRVATICSTRPSILLVAKRSTLEAIAERRPEVGVAFAKHCRRRMIANLLQASPILSAVSVEARPALVERFVTRTFEKADRIIARGREVEGLYLVASGKVSVVGFDGDEPIVLETLEVGETIGDVSLVLRRVASADVIAVHPTVTLFLPRDDFMALVREYPAILHPLYMRAVERDSATKSVLADDVVDVHLDDLLLS